MRTQKIGALLFVLIGLFFLGSYIGKATRNELTTLRDVSLVSYNCEKQKYSSFTHSIVLKNGKELHNTTKQECIDHLLQKIIKENLLVNVRTDGREFYQIISGRKSFYNLQQELAGLEKRKYTTLFLVIAFLGMAIMLVYKDSKMKSKESE